MSAAASARVVIAPDSFKGTFTATEVADALAAGVGAAGPRAVVLPIGDGGEGTMAVLVTALGGTLHEATVSGPLGHPVEARWALLPDGRTAVVELAQASGLGLVPATRRDAWEASTRGTGELIAAAVHGGAEHVLVTVGGSATTDGGAGALEALDASGVLPRLTVVCDVDTRWEDAPRVFGPQKGADPETVARLERRLEALAQHAPRDPRGVPLTGGAGGLSGGLWAWRDAELVAGAEYVLDTLGFDALADGALCVLTGEGGLDEQTFAGKAVGAVAKRCGRLGVPCHAFVGVSRLTGARAAQLGLASVTETPTRERIALAAEVVVDRAVGSAP